jgi:hypothetical protein
MVGDKFFKITSAKLAVVCFGRETILSNNTRRNVNGLSYMTHSLDDGQFSRVFRRKLHQSERYEIDRFCLGFS